MIIVEHTAFNELQFRWYQFVNIDQVTDCSILIRTVVRIYIGVVFITSLRNNIILNFNLGMFGSSDISIKSNFQSSLRLVLETTYKPLEIAYISLEIIYTLLLISYICIYC